MEEEGKELVGEVVEQRVVVEQQGREAGAAAFIAPAAKAAEATLRRPPRTKGGTPLSLTPPPARPGPAEIKKHATFVCENTYIPYVTARVRAPARVSLSLEIMGCVKCCAKCFRCVAWRDPFFQLCFAFPGCHYGIIQGRTF